MLAHVIETATPDLIMLLVVSLVITGLVKGMIGVGMPTVAFPLLSMLVDVQTSVMLLSMPLVLSNIPQVRNPVQRGHRFQRKAGSNPVIADSR